MTEFHGVAIPMDPSQILSKDMCPKTQAESLELRNIPYQEANECLMYAAQFSTFSGSIQSLK